MNKKRKIQPLWLFYFLVAYALLQFSWWTYLLIKLNRSLLFLEGQSNGSFDWESAYNTKVYMIAGEGLVFFSIMIFGIYQIQRSFKRELELAKLQKNFLLSVTHELKTPIASVRLGLETMQKHELSREQQKGIIAQGISEADRLNILIEKILFSTRLEDHGVILNPIERNISDLLKITLETPINTIAKDHEVHLNIQPDVHAEVDEWAFKSIVINLFENALKYSSSGTKVWVDLKLNDRMVELSIADEGQGIAEEDRNKIFKKFVRLENEDTRSVQGTGLGLYIVKSLVYLHQGSIECKDNTPKGTRFTIYFNA